MVLVLQPARSIRGIISNKEYFTKDETLRVDAYSGPG